MNGDPVSRSDWQLYSQTFVAIGPTTTLTFTSTDDNQFYGIFLDAVSMQELSASPNRRAYAAGHQLLGCAGTARRRRVSQVVSGDWLSVENAHVSCCIATQSCQETWKTVAPRGCGASLQVGIV
jgi:hypothetical protein